MKRYGLIQTLVFAVLFTAVSTATAATLRKVEWQEGGEAATDTLILTFDSHSPKVQVDSNKGGLELWFAGVDVPTGTLARIRAAADAGGARLFLDRPATALRSLTVEDTVVRVVLARAAAAPHSASAYRIGVGDVVGIAIYKNPDLSGEFQVQNDGAFTMPLLGSVKAEGKTAEELSEELTAILAKDFLVDPQVSVTLKTYQSQWIYVTGSVGRAVRIPLSPGMTLKDALSEAGVALAPGQTVTLTRTGEPEATTFDSAALESVNCPDPRDGDVLTVAEPSFFYIQGEVRRPGKFPVSPSMTVLQAIAVAEGLTDWASKREVHIRRTVGDKTSDQVVNLKKVEDRKVPDPPVLPGDVILVKRKVL